LLLFKEKNLLTKTSLIIKYTCDYNFTNPNPYREKGNLRGNIV